MEHTQQGIKYTETSAEFRQLAKQTCADVKIKSTEMTPEETLDRLTALTEEAHRRAQVMTMRQLQ